jgi:hypothetical protein
MGMGGGALINFLSEFKGAAALRAAALLLICFWWWWKS